MLCFFVLATVQLNYTVWGVVLEIDIQSNRTSPFIGAYSFPSNTGLMCKVMQIVILLTLPSIYRAILPSPESHGKWRFDCIW